MNLYNGTHWQGRKKIMVQMLCHGIYSMLLSGKALHTSNSTHLFSNLETPVCILVQTLSFCIANGNYLKTAITDWLFLKAHFSVRC